MDGRGKGERKNRGGMGEKERGREGGKEGKMKGGGGGEGEKEGKEGGREGGREGLGGEGSKEQIRSEILTPAAASRSKRRISRTV